MKAERWERIEELYHAARQIDADNRAVFINEACGDDDELRRSLEVLLKHGEHESFLNTPAFENMGHLLDAPFSQVSSLDLMRWSILLAQVAWAKFIERVTRA